MVHEQPIDGRYEELGGPLLGNASSLPDLSITLVPSTGPIPTGVCSPICLRFYPPVPSPEWLLSRPPAAQLLYSVSEILPSERLNLCNMHPLDTTYPAILSHSTAYSYLTPSLYSATISAYNEAARDSPSVRGRMMAVAVLLLVSAVVLFMVPSLGDRISLSLLLGVWLPISALLTVSCCVVLARLMRSAWQTLVQRVCAVLREANGELQRSYQRAKAGEGSALRLAQWRWVTEKKEKEGFSAYVLCLVDVQQSDEQFLGGTV
jgi:hypothetical protein